MRVRIGVDTDTAYPLDGSYVAMGVHRAARIQAAAHGGQLLVTRDTWEALTPGVREALHATPLGSFRLKDIADPVPLVDVAEAPWTPPVPRASVAFRSRIPRPRDSFVGRAADLDAVTRLLAESSLVTLTGPGGIGKTRLAAELAHRISEAIDGPAWFVDLSGIDDPERVPSVVASTIGLRQDEEAASVLLVAEHLASTDGLIVLDNCEHLLDAVADLVEEILAAAPRMQVLCTSREALDVRGEQRWPVKALSLPTPATFQGDGELAPSAALFLDRARLVDPGLVVTPAMASAVAVLCRQLDGLPLALELAAARLATVPLVDLPGLLEEQLDSLSGDRRRDPRHGTLARVLESSVATLTGSQRAALAALSVFRGGADLAAITQVLGTADARQLLDDLVRRSLVEVDSSEDSATGETRWRLLETVRFHAAGMVEDPDELAGRHAAWVLDHVRRVGAAHGTSDQPRWADWLAQEQTNISAAFAWLCEHDRERGLELASSAAATLVAMGQGALSRDLLTAALEGAVPGSAGEARAQTVLGRHLTLYVSPEGEGPRLLRAALTTGRALGDDHIVLGATVGLASWAREVSQDLETTRELFESAIAISRSLGERGTEANTLGVYALLHSEEGNDQVALQHARSAVLIAEETDNQHTLAVAEHALSLVSWMAGDLVTSRAMAERGLRRFTELGERRGALLCLAALSCAERSEGVLDWAALHLDESFQLMAELDTRSTAAFLLLLTSALLAQVGDDPSAVALVGLARALREAGGETTGRFERTVEQEALASSVEPPGADLSPARVEAAIAEARAALQAVSTPVTGFAPAD